MIVRRYRITGRVQGVGFRWFTKTLAGTDIRGTVRNTEDGSVEVIAAGEADDLDDFAARLRSGPPTADVRGFEEVPLQGDPDLGTGFTIIR